MTHENSAANEILRWIAFIPAALACAIVAPIIIALLNAMAPSFWQNTIGELIKSAVSGVAFVYVGAITAPRARFPTSVFLVVLYGILNGWIMGRGGLTPWLTTNIIVGILAALGTCAYIKQEFPEREETK